MRVTAVMFFGTGVFWFAYFGQNIGAYRGALPRVQAVAPGRGPSYTLSVGTDATGYPYQPRVFAVPGRRAFRLTVTDHVGCCLLAAEPLCGVRFANRPNAVFQRELTFMRLAAKNNSAACNFFSSPHT